MTPSECMTTLGLAESASFDEVKRAYRRLAQQLHPDKNRGDDGARRRFVQVSRAYRMLAGAADGRQRGRRIGTCIECGDLSEVSLGTDGHPRCQRCIFRPAGGRLLPYPALVVVKCVNASLFLVFGAYLLIVAWSTGSQFCALGAFGAGLVSLLVLARTCVSVVHCLQPAERIRYRRQRRFAGV